MPYIAGYRSHWGGVVTEGAFETLTDVAVAYGDALDHLGEAGDITVGDGLPEITLANVLAAIQYDHQDGWLRVCNWRQYRQYIC